MPARFWKKEEHCSLMVGKKASEATMEISAEDPQKRKKINLPYDTVTPLPGTCPGDSTPYSTDNLLNNVQSCPAHNSWKWIQSVLQWMNGKEKCGRYTH